MRNVKVEVSELRRRIADAFAEDFGENCPVQWTNKQNILVSAKAGETLGRGRPGIMQRNWNLRFLIAMPLLKAKINITMEISHTQST